MTESHPPHVCVNCRLPIPPDEPEIKVDMEALKTRKLARGGRLRKSDYSSTRYQHVSYERCAELERGAR